MNKRCFFWIFILTITSCVIKKNNVKDKDYQTYTTPIDLINKINSKNNQFNWIRIKGRVNANQQNTESIAFNTVMKIKRDSIIWASVSAPFGIELFRIMLNHDSLYFVNHIKKSYYVKPINFVNDFINANLNYNDIQDLLIGDITVGSEDYVNKDSFSLLIKNRKYFIDTNLYKPIKIIYQHENNLIEVKYDYLENIKIPHKIQLSSGLDKRISIKYIKHQLDKKQKIVFNIPKSYANIED